MKIFKLFILSVVLFSIQSCSLAQTATSTDAHTIYLVRHSEKDHSSENKSDLPLSKCGERRSEALSEFLQDVNLDAIYSTDYTRTRNTAAPTAAAKNLDVEIYDASNLASMAELLLAANQDVLVVGHSNTTAVLAGLLVGKQLGDIDLSIYDRIYQVVICGDATNMNLLHSSFECGE